MSASGLEGQTRDDAQPQGGEQGMGGEQSPKELPKRSGVDSPLIWLGPWGVVGWFRKFGLPEP